MSGNWKLTSEIFGWIYFCVWSISFYPQLLLNYQIKSVEGLSLDFLLANLLGFFCYGTFNLFLYLNEDVRKDYKKLYGKDVLVSLADVAFSSHAFAITIISGIQYFYYKDKERLREVRHSIVWFLFVSLAVFIFYVVALWTGISFVHFLYALSLVKIVTSFSKYLPQMILNWQRKCTIGWSLYNIILDLVGGIASEIQLFIDIFNTDDGDILSAIKGHPVKFALGLASLVFDLIFIYQHILYSQKGQGSFITLDDECEEDECKENQNFPIKVV